MEQPRQAATRPIVERIAHRGAKREFPENTVPAFQRAFARGATGIELDVHATADGVVVVHHDPEVRGLAAGSNAINELEWRQVQMVELGAGPDNAHVGIPRLSDVLAIVPAGATVYVEIKGSGIEQAVASVIRSSAASCAVHSFDHDAIGRMREIAPEVPRGILFERVPENVESAIRKVGARDVWPERTLIDRALVAAVHAAGSRVIAWTVNSHAEAQRLVDSAVDGLCGDDVRVFADA